ncbi:hypothetical protein EJB05_42759, partial [Eragrostis curvula]
MAPPPPPRAAAAALLTLLLVVAAGGTSTTVAGDGRRKLEAVAVSGEEETPRGAVAGVWHSTDQVNNPSPFTADR